jgi:Ca2+-transporting ATPase
MNLAISSSLVLILVVIYVPFFNTIFNTLPLGLAQWEVIVPLLLVPSVAAELTKYFFSPARRHNYSM